MEGSIRRRPATLLSGKKDVAVGFRPCPPLFFFGEGKKRGGGVLLKNELCAGHGRRPREGGRGVGRGKGGFMSHGGGRLDGE